MRQSEPRFRDLFDRAPIPCEELDCQGAIRRLNQAACTLLRCSPEETAGRHAWDLLAPDRQQEFRDALLERISQGRETGPFECEYQLMDGTHLTVDVRESLVRDDRGEVTGAVRWLLDITERNLAAMAARKVQQYAMELRNKNEQLGRALYSARSATVAKSRFLAGVSHELRTPLNGIIGFSELLYDQKIGTLADEQRAVLGDILASARHLLQLINAILDISRVEAGRIDFTPESCRLQELAQEVSNLLRPLAERKSIVIGMDVPAGLTAYLDPSRFKQVLYNYLSNAVKYTPAQGRIAVRISPEEENRFRLEVEDNGIGIAAEELPRLFHEFSQLPNSRRADQGTGLGLALTRHIVESQGGSVSVRSEPGKGSVFSAVLPLE